MRCLRARAPCSPSSLEALQPSFAVRPDHTLRIILTRTQSAHPIERAPDSCDTGRLSSGESKKPGLSRFNREKGSQGSSLGQHVFSSIYAQASSVRV